MSQLDAPPARRVFWTFLITSVASFMVSLDNLVVTTALPSIRADLDAGLEGLEWTVNAYTLSFGVLLLTGATLGERFGRRRVMTLGLTIFTVASAAAAIAPGIVSLDIARAVQGAGAALVLPITLTMLSAAVPAELRGAALGVWGAVNGLAVAFGPLVGGVVVEGLQWQWIFWINVPIGLVLIPLAATKLAPGRGAPRSLDLPGLVLVSTGLLGVVFGLVRGEGHGWTSGQVLASIGAGAALLAAFVGWEARTAEPMLPLSMWRNRTFATSNVVSLIFSFGMFGSIFLLAQYLQAVQGSSPLEAGIKTLPWTAMPLLIAPIAGPLSDRIGGRPLLIVGLALQALGLGALAFTMTTDTSYATIAPIFAMSGVGMALTFVPMANVVLGSVPSDLQGMASGTNNAVREVGGVFGVAVLASVFASRGGYGSPQEFVDGTVPALVVGAALLAVGAGVAAILPRRRSDAVVPAPRTEADVPVLTSA